MRQPEKFNYTIIHGFTLIELLVVISIIALLVSILLPSLNLARGLAKSVVCGTNLKNMGTALSIYAEDSRDLFPLASGTGVWGELIADSGLYSWMEQLYPYHGSKKVYLCPEKPRDTDYSYFLSVRAGYLDAGNQMASTNRNRIQFSSAFVVSGCTNYDEFIHDDCDKDDYSQNCIGYPVHEKTQSVLFADQHVKPYAEFQNEQITFRYTEISAW